MNRMFIASMATVALLAGPAAPAAPAGEPDAPAEAEATEEARDDAEPQDEPESTEEALEDILNTPLSAEEYTGDNERCLSGHDYRSIDVLDDEHVMFRGSRDRIWLNKLRHRCVGLRRGDTLRFEMRSNRLCELDHFQSVDRTLYSMRTSANCTLGEFQAVTPEQAEAIEVAFDEARDR